MARLNEAEFLNSGVGIDLRDRSKIDRLEYKPSGRSPLQFVIDGVIYTVPVEDVIDLAAEKARLTKAMDAAAKERDTLSKRLENPAFVERAKPEIGRESWREGVWQYV